MVGRAATCAAPTWRAARPTFIAHPAPLDLDAAWDAGTGAAMAPRVTASADGIGLAVWGERDGAGATRVVARRLVRDRLAASGAEANAATSTA